MKPTTQTLCVIAPINFRRSRTIPRVARTRHTIRIAGRLSDKIVPAVGPTRGGFRLLAAVKPAKADATLRTCLTVIHKHLGLDAFKRAYIGHGKRAEQIKRQCEIQCNRTAILRAGYHF